MVLSAVSVAIEPPGALCTPLAVQSFGPSSPGAPWPWELVPPGEDEVHLWMLPLDAFPFSWDAAHDVLSPEERDRAARNRFPVQQRRFVVRRAWLRLLLASYLRNPPATVRLAAEVGGKPRLDPRHDLHFNVSDSADWFICAFAQGRDVGVDLEQIRPIPSAGNIVERYFSSAERALLAAWEQLDPANAFWFAWTFKEAHGKAVGTGVTHRLEQHLPQPPRHDLVGWGDWSARTWQPNADLVATVVARGAGWIPQTCAIRV